MQVHLRDDLYNWVKGRRLSLRVRVASKQSGRNTMIIPSDTNPVYANFASNRANLSLSEEKLRYFQPDAFGIRGLLWSMRKRVRVHSDDRRVLL